MKNMMELIKDHKEMILAIFLLIVNTILSIAITTIGWNWLMPHRHVSLTTMIGLMILLNGLIYGMFPPAQLGVLMKNFQNREDQTEDFILGSAVIFSTQITAAAMLGILTFFR